MSNLINLVSSVAKINTSYLEAPPEHVGSTTIGAVNYDVWSLLRTKKYDMSGNLVVPLDTELLFFDYTYNFLDDESYFVVPQLNKRVLSENIFKEYTVYVWLFVIITSVICSFFLYLAVKNLEDDDHVSREPTWLSWARIMMDYPVFINPKRCSARLLLCCLFILTLIMNTLFRSRMFVDMSAQTSSQWIKTVNEIKESGLKTGFSEIVHRQLNSSQEDLEKYFSRTSIYCDLSLSCLNRTAYDKDFVTVKMMTQMKYLIPKLYTNNEGKSMLYIIDNYRVNSLTFGFLFRKGHPLFQKMDKYSHLLSEGGFVQYFCKKIDVDFNRAMALADTRSRFQVEPLPLAYFQATFLVVSFGFGLSIFVFCLELVHHYYVMKKYMKKGGCAAKDMVCLE